MAADRRHLLTVNLEDYFHVDAFDRSIQPERWPRFASRLEVTTPRTLELLAKHDAKAKFFVLGTTAEKMPGLVRSIVEAGHEVAVRGFFHRSVAMMTPYEFKADTIRARTAVEQAIGRQVVGYRVADGWFGPKDSWALDILCELGFAYDSSIAPMGKDFGRDPQRSTPHEHLASSGKTLLEIPISTGLIAGFQVPVAGGNYLRQIPRLLTRRAAARWMAKHPESPLVAYFHTWELDPEQPEITGVGWLSKLRHYRNLGKMPAKIGELLSAHRFGSISDYLKLTPQPLADWAAPQQQGPSKAVSTGPRTPVSIVVPCFNEEAMIEHLPRTFDEIERELGGSYEIEFLVVDDGSTDRTWELLGQHFGERAAVQLVRHRANAGIAAAIMTGIRNAHNDTVCSMDSDGSYDPLKLGEMIPLLSNGVDLVTASPYHPDGGVRNVPGWRLWLSKGCAWLYRRALRTKLHTYTSCFRVYRRSTVAAIPLVNSRYLGIAELVGRLDLARKTIVEYPAVLESRVIGRSKMKVVRTIFGHFGLIARLVLDRYREQTSPDRDLVIRSQLGYLKDQVIADVPNAPRLPSAVPPTEQTPLGRTVRPHPATHPFPAESHRGPR